MALFAGNSFASDLQPPIYMKAESAAPGYDWSGFYLGSHVGLAAGRSDWTLAPLGGPSPCTSGIATACIIDNSLATAIAGSSGKSGYYFNATGSAVAGSPFNDQFYSTGTPLTNTSGTRAYCSIEDAVVRLQPAGNITLVPSYAACSVLTPMN